MISHGVRLPVNRYVIFFSLLFGGLAADLISKTLIFQKYYDVAGRYTEPVWLVGEFLGIQCSTNPGALFGLGSGYSWLFASISVFAVIGLISWLFLFKAAQDRWLNFALGMICGGILGNFYDRVGFGWRPEYLDSVKTNVRDWIHFRIEGVPLFDPWPNFNIADSLLVCGAIMLFLHALLGKPPESESSSESETT